MKNFSFQLSKRNVVIIGCCLIFLLLIINRIRIWYQFNKIKGIYIEWTSAGKNANIAYLLDFFQDTAFVQSMISDIHTPYTIGYIDKQHNAYKQLDYTLLLKSGSKITVLANKENKEDVREFVFFSFWLPYIIIAIAICGVWALILHVFFERTYKFIYSFRKNKENEM